MDFRNVKPYLIQHDSKPEDILSHVFLRRYMNRQIESRGNKLEFQIHFKTF